MFQIDEIIKSTEWIIGETSIKHVTKIYDCCKEPYPSITITVNLIRRSPSYKALIITPAFVIIGLILSSFWLPPQAGEKLILNGCTAIIVTIFLLYFTQKIPAMGSHTPLVGKLFEIVKFSFHSLTAVKISLVVTTLKHYSKLFAYNT
ncbi:neurotransmitter gated ion channel [Holotrichia oblita]|uniref:Neurotransmitter gated ion channel n=1 Tax=Holotrichia oblita TaxID=644536 RepID=A0ACB9T7S6_HOLOL|nr:neurotransmitter gated ion channel [Holotrichia oblita]